MRKLLAILFCASMLCAWGRAVLTSPVTSTVPSKVSASAVGKAITAAATGLKWIPHTVDGKTIEAKLLVRSHELVVNIAYSSSQYTISYKSSKNLDYNEKKQTIHRKYAEWVRNLDVAIQKEIASPGSSKR